MTIERETISKGYKLLEQLKAAISLVEGLVAFPDEPLLMRTRSTAHSEIALGINVVEVSGPLARRLVGSLIDHIEAELRQLDIVVELPMKLLRAEDAEEETRG
jgi:hypothetical protein